MNNGPVFKFRVSYIWRIGAGEMIVEALDIIQAATIAKKKLAEEKPIPTGGYFIDAIVRLR